MFLKKSTNKKTGRTHLSIVMGYRDKNGKTRHKTVKSLGYLDVLEKNYQDPISYFTNLAKTLPADEMENDYLIPRLPTSRNLQVETDNLTNLGYFYYNKIIVELGLNKALMTNNSIWDSGPLMIKVLSFLLYTHLIFDPSFQNSSISLYKSNRDSFNLYYYLDKYFEIFKITKKEMTDGLTTIKRKRKYIVNTVYEKLLTLESTSRPNFHYNFPVTYTNDGLSSVYLNLILDDMHRPLRYTLSRKDYFQTIENKKAQKKQTHMNSQSRKILISHIPSLDEKYITDILYDDKGYILNVSIKTLSQEIKDFILDETHYPFKENSDGSFLKSRIFPRRITVIDPLSQKRTSIITKQRQIVYYSSELATQMKLNSNSYLNPESSDLFNGYVFLVSSELYLSPEDTVLSYENFYHTSQYFKNTLSSNPLSSISVSPETTIEVSILISFLSTVILSYLEFITEGAFYKHEIKTSISNCQCSHISEYYYVLHHYDEVLKVLNEKLKINLDYKIMSSQQLKEVSKKINKSNSSTDS